MSTALDYVLLAEQYLSMAAEVAATETKLDQEDALRRLYHSGLAIRSARAIAAHANDACEFNEKAEGWS